MAPTYSDVTFSAPAKSKVLLNIKCRKCNKTVRNGILCDMCDWWHHFKCASIEENNIPAENIEWACPACVGVCSDELPNVSNDLPVDSRKDSDTLLAVVAALKNEINILTVENKRLVKILENNDLGLEQRKRLESNSEWTPVQKSGRPNRSNFINSLEHFPPLSNRFSVFNSFSDDDATDQNTVNSPTQNPLSLGPLIHKPRSTKGKPKAQKMPEKCKPIKIKCFSDSQGRQVAKEVMMRSQHKFVNMMKPGARLEKVTEECKAMCSDLGKEDVAVLLAGTNDVAHNESNQLVRSLKSRLSDLLHTNVLVFSVPHRHDLLEWSCVNKEVHAVNKRIKNICRHFRNVSFIDLASLGSRFHTSHGLHLNSLGKQFVADKILDVVNNVNGHLELSKEAIPLGFNVGLGVFLE